jgi:hypothetical protein
MRVFQIRFESGHYSDDDDQRRYANSHANDREQRDQGNNGLARLGFQIATAYEQFQTTSAPSYTIGLVSQ